MISSLMTTNRRRVKRRFQRYGINQRCESPTVATPADSLLLPHHAHQPQPPCIGTRNQYLRHLRFLDLSSLSPLTYVDQGHSTIHLAPFATRKHEHHTCPSFETRGTSVSIPRRNALTRCDGSIDAPDLAGHRPDCSVPARSPERER